MPMQEATIVPLTLSPVWWFPQVPHSELKRHSIANRPGVSSSRTFRKRPFFATACGIADPQADHLAHDAIMVNWCMCPSLPIGHFGSSLKPIQGLKNAVPDVTELQQ